MVTINLSLSGSAFYKFTEPVRKFKANDPYYYEVDNIPLKQLEENILWLKDAVQNATIEVDQQETVAGGASRSTFTELQPFVSGTNSNVVSVRPGRFIGRINDAYDLNPLQVIKRVSGFEVGEFDEWQVAAIDNLLLSPTILKFKSLVAGNSLGMNGLAERSFGSFIMNDLDSVGATQPDRVSPLYELFGLTGQNSDFSLPYFLWTGSPRISADLLSNENLGPSLNIKQFETGGSETNTQGFFQLFHADTQFIKKWRGVARTAVVDVPENLSINIERFYSDDFNYIDEEEVLIDSSFAGTAPAQATHRIDLLFIYSKPVDTSAVHLNNGWTGEVPRKIYKAELGIVKGAGVTLNYYNGSFPTAKFVTANFDQAILAQYADQLNENLGFKSLDIQGSFPSPDDLMNLSPSLAEWLPTTHFALVGQSILPIAYIVVKKDQINENGDQVVEPENIIDIRPFFRTTELTYGERAGIAAALPNLSLANPVATEAFVNYEGNRMKAYVDGEIQRVRTDLSTPASELPMGGIGTIIARGIVRGGNYYGPEGALCRAIQAQYSLDKQQTIEKFKELHNLPSNYELKNLPDWDLANWTYQNVTGTTTSYPSIGYGVTDRINHWFNRSTGDGGNYFYGHTATTENNNNVDFGPFIKAQIVAGRDSRMFSTGFGGTFDPQWNNAATGSTSRLLAKLSLAYWISKTISIDITNTQWVRDITVVPNYWNCGPHLTDIPTVSPTIFVSKGKRRGPILVANPTGPAIQKYFIDFTIFVVYPSAGKNTVNNGTWINSLGNLPNLLNSLEGLTNEAPPYAYRASLLPMVTRIGGLVLPNYNPPTSNPFYNFYTYSHCLQWKDNGDPWISNNEVGKGFGAIGLPTVAYPSVEFTVIGHPQNYTGNATSPFPNDIHKVPGINSHENYTSTSRSDRPALVASDNMATNT